MKKCFLSLLLIMACASTSLADSTGSAYIPHVFSYLSPSGPLSLTNIYVSNKTAETVDVKIALYGAINNNGAQNLLKDTSSSAFSGIIRSSGSLTNYSETTSGYSATFTLHAFESGWVQLQPPASPADVPEFGHGKIEWSTPTQGVTGALLAYGFARYIPPSGNFQSSIIINGGNPF